MNQKARKLMVKRVPIEFSRIDLLTDYFRKMSVKGLFLHSVEFRQTFSGEKLFCKFVKKQANALNYCTVLYDSKGLENLYKFMVCQQTKGWSLLCADYKYNLFIFCSENYNLQKITELPELREKTAELAEGAVQFGIA